MQLSFSFICLLWPTGGGISVAVCNGVVFALHGLCVNSKSQGLSNIAVIDLRAYHFNMGENLGGCFAGIYNISIVIPTIIKCPMLFVDIKLKDLKKSFEFTVEIK